jgi:conjugal transfer pilus assembly protein TraB
MSKQGSAVPDSGSVKKKKMVYSILIGGAVIAVLAFLMAVSDKGAKKTITVQEKPVTTSFTTAGSQISDQESWIAEGETKLDKMMKMIKQMDQRVKQMEMKNEGLKSDLSDLKKETSKVGKQTKLPPLPLPTKSQTGGGTALSQPRGPVAKATNGNYNFRPSKKGKGKDYKPEIVTIDIPVPKDVGPKGKLKKVKTIKDYIPSGSFTKAVILGGVDAPTGSKGEQNPQPILMRLVGNSFLPNKYRKKTKECLIVAAAMGDLASERALIRTERMSCILRDGTIQDIAIKGTVFDETGKNGIRGKLISRQGSALGKAFLAGLASGFGETFAGTTGTQSVSPLGTTTTYDAEQALQAGGAQGIANASQQVAEYYMNLAKQLIPVVSIPAGRFVTVVLIEGANLSTDS